jgi:hypothetical protein
VEKIKELVHHEWFFLSINLIFKINIRL